MVRVKERSGLFKFFYVFFQIILSPLTFVKYVLKHPLWIFCILLIGFLAVVYYPLQQGITLKGIPRWYKDKYVEIKLDAVSHLANSGEGLISEESLRDLKGLQKELTEDVDETNRVKGENFNEKISRDKTLDTKMESVKKRGGFRRKGEKEQEQLSTEVAETVGGGLANILQVSTDNKDSKDAQKDVEPEPKPQAPILENMIEKEGAHNVPAEKDMSTEKQDDVDEFDLF